MRSDVHREALRAAARVAFSVSLVGCSGTTQPATQPTPEEDASGATEPYPSNNSSYDANVSSKEGGEASTTLDSAVDAQATEDASVVSPAGCEGLFASTFLNPGQYPGEKKDSVSPLLASCCESMLLWII